MKVTAPLITPTRFGVKVTPRVQVEVFKLAPNSNGGWKETVLHTFVDHPGASPVGGGLIFDANGNLYGETAGDGNINTFGSVFEISP